MLNVKCCVGQAMTLSPIDPNLQELCHGYTSTEAMTRHFRSKHLKLVDPSQLRPCPSYVPEIWFCSILHLQSHAMRGRGICQGKVWTLDGI